MTLSCSSSTTSLGVNPSSALLATVTMPGLSASLPSLLRRSTLPARKEKRGEVLIREGTRDEPSGLWGSMATGRMEAHVEAREEEEGTDASEDVGGYF